MGCSQSKTSIDQVTERNSINSPTTEALVSESKTVAEPEVAVEASPAIAKESLTISESEKVPEDPPASADEMPTASLIAKEVPEVTESAVVEVATGTIHQTDEAKVPVAPEDSVEEPAAPAEEDSIAEASATKEVEAVEMETEVLSTKEVEAVEMETEVLSTKEVEAVEMETEVFSTKEVKAVETEIEVSSIEPAVDEEALQSKSAQTPAEEVSVEAEPVVEASQTSVADPVKPVSEGSLTFIADDVAFNDDNVAFYTFSAIDSTNPANELRVSKRYSDFKVLHAQLLQLLANSNEEKAFDLPVLPKTSFLQGRKNLKMLEERKTQFTVLLNAIAAHPVASHSDIFKAFLA